MEVHDVDGRLNDILTLLRPHFAFVRAERQTSAVFTNEAGEPEYRLTVPDELNLYYLFATNLRACEEK